MSKQPLDDDLTSLLEAIANPMRRDILARLLEQEEMTVGQLSDRYPVSQPAITRHLKKLESAGLISRRSEGQTRVITLELRRFLQVADWIQPFLKRREKIQDLLEEARRGSRRRSRAKGKSK